MQNILNKSILFCCGQEMVYSAIFFYHLFASILFKTFVIIYIPSCHSIPARPAFLLTTQLEIFLIKFKRFLTSIHSIATTTFKALKCCKDITLWRFEINTQTKSFLSHCSTLKITNSSSPLHSQKGFVKNQHSVCVMLLTHGVILRHFMFILY